MSGPFLSLCTLTCARIAVRADVLGVVLILASLPSTAQGQGSLQALRDDVRATPTSDGDSKRPRHDECEHQCRNDHRTSSESDWSGVYTFAFHLIASPFWGPPVLLGDDFQSAGAFARFPYDRVPGYMMREDCRELRFVHGDPADDPASVSCAPEQGGYWRREWPTRPRRWSGRLRVEFNESFDDLHQINGHLLLEDATRFGLDVQTSYFEESFLDRRHDQLLLGDANVTFRFAQSEQMQWRAGMGLNWLADSIDTDLGFNFTYGVDWFVRRPWVVSSELDWGSLGRAELFRFRTTAGVTFHGLEGYVGYEYLDIDRLHQNSLFAGVGIWF